VAFAALFATRIRREAFRLDYVSCIFRINEIYPRSLTLNLVVAKLPKIEFGARAYTRVKMWSNLCLISTYEMDASILGI